MAKHSVNVIVKARDEASRKFKGIGKSASGMGNMLKKAAAAAVVYFGARAIARFTKSSLEAFAKQEEAEFRLATVLKSTEYASKMTVKQLIRQAKALQSITIYGDEVIMSLQAIILTFKEIKSDVFERTTKVILDMSTALSQDLKQGAIQVGKALNDPILGVTALGRVGVMFTEQQKKTIRSFVESGNIMKAQILILNELESEFGGMSGAADKLGRMWQQMINAIGDAVKENIGEALAPEFKKFAKTVKEWAEENNKQIGIWAKKTVATIILVKDVMSDFIEFMKTDWRAGLKFALDAFIELLQATFKASVRMALTAGNAMWQAFFEGPISERDIGKEMFKILDELGIRKEGGYSGREYIRAMRAKGYTSEKGYPAPPSLRVLATERLEQQKINYLIGDTLELMRKDYKKAFDDIAAKTPPALAEATGESWDKYLARFAAMDSPVRTSWMDLIKEWRTSIREWWARPEKTGASAALATAINQQLRPLESRFLTFAPGTRFNKTEQNTALTAKNTQSTAGTLKELIKLTKQVINEVRKIPGPWPLRMTDFK